VVSTTSRYHEPMCWTPLPCSIRRHAGAASLALLSATGAAISPTAYQDARLSEVLSVMTLDEKISQMGNSAPAIPRVNLPAYQWENEGTHGVAAGGATVFPQAIALAATFDPDLAERVAVATALEARNLYSMGRGGLTFWAPVMNLARDPRWGRTQETFGEDPLLAARMGVAFVKGLQGDPDHPRVIATPKHFAANNDEVHRHTGSSTIPLWQLRAFYLPHFEACIREGGAQSVMCAYNALNDTPCCADPWLLSDTLRSDWGFTGYVVADCGAVGQIETTHGCATSPEEAAAMALKAGVDLDCGDTYQKNLAGAVKDGLVTTSMVDRAVTRLLRARARLGLLSPPPARAPGISDGLDIPANRSLALEVARKSIVLLRNPGALLPFRKNVTSVAVIGPSAAVKRLGAYSAWGTRIVTPL